MRRSSSLKSQRPSVAPFRSSLQTALVVLAATAALSPFAARAQTAQQGAYVGGSLGQGRWMDSAAGVTGGRTDLSGKVYGGYQFTPNFALEAGGVALGESNRADGSIKGSATFVDAVGTLPLTPKWSAIGRAGVLRGKVDTTRGDDYGNGLKLGAGAQYSLTQKTALVGEWERYKLDVFGTRPEVNQFTMGVKARF